MTAAPGNNGKMVAGCGGCGCAGGLLLLVVGVLLFIWGNNDGKVKELIPVGGVLMGAAGLANFFGLVVLVVGLVLMKSAPPPPPK